jgi:hypothetical protein
MNQASATSNDNRATIVQLARDIVEIAENGCEPGKGRDRAHTISNWFWEDPGLQPAPVHRAPSSPSRSRTRSKKSPGRSTAPPGWPARPWPASNATPLSALIPLSAFSDSPPNPVDKPARPWYHDL